MEPCAQAQADMLTYLAGQSHEFRRRLYQMPTFCTFILKLLPSHTVSFIFDLLRVAKNVAALHGSSELKLTIKILRSLQLIERRGKNLFLDDAFRNSLFLSFAMIERVGLFEVVEDGKGTSHVSGNFESVLQGIVEGNVEDVSIRRVLIHGDLIDAKQTITSKGFEFLLKTRREQLWEIIVHGIEVLSKSDEERLSCVSIIAELGHVKLGREYKVGKARKIFELLSSLGLVEISKWGSFIPSVNLRTLFSDEKSSGARFMIIETNYKVYAYTASRYEVSILSLFCTICETLAFLVIGKITEESVGMAMDKGITASQIVHYLESYSRGLPQAIKELIFIWEIQRNRIVITDAVLYSDFLNIDDFKIVLKFCKERNFLLDYDEQKRVIAISVYAKDTVREFVKSKTSHAMV